ncbi:MAG: hypothetical protein WCT39_03815 [Candidatus Margulisiibacteriota bacterium]
MKNKNPAKFNIKNIFKAKEKLHKKLAQISFDKKITMLFQLQEIAKNLKAA